MGGKRPDTAPAPKLKNFLRVLLDDDTFGYLDKETKHVYTKVLDAGVANAAVNKNRSESELNDIFKNLTVGESFVNLLK